MSNVIWTGVVVISVVVAWIVAFSRGEDYGIEATAKVCADNHHTVFGVDLNNWSDWVPIQHADLPFESTWQPGDCKNTDWYSTPTGKRRVMDYVDGGALLWARSGDESTLIGMCNDHTGWLVYAAPFLSHGGELECIYGAGPSTRVDGSPGPAVPAWSCHQKGGRL